MSNEVERIVQQTEALLRLRHEETLQETTPQRLHECLGEVVMMQINDSWVKTKKRQTAGRRAFYFSAEYLGITKEDDLAQAIIEAGAKSKAALFVAQMQDYLGLGGEARMNEPGTLKVENWRWRMLPGQADAQLAQKILRLTQDVKRV